MGIPGHCPSEGLGVQTVNSVTRIKTIALQISYLQPHNILVTFRSTETVPLLLTSQKGQKAMPFSPHARHAYHTMLTNYDHIYC